MARAEVDTAAVQGAVVAHVVITAVLWGNRPAVFVTGSMSPTIGTGAGAAVPIEADEIRPDDAICAVPFGTRYE